MTELEKRYEKQLNKNEPFSYFAYVAQNGRRTDDRLYDNLVKADTEHRLSSSDYGSRADRLTDSGLNASGYEDYLKTKNDGKFIKRTSGASLEKKIDEYKNNVDYENYLSDYEALQSKISQSVIKEIGNSGNFSIEEAYTKAIRAGIAKNLAYVTAEAGVAKAKENAVNKAIQYAKINNLTANGAKEYAIKLGLEESYANRVYNEISSLTEKEKNFYANMSSKDYYDYIKAQAEK